MRSRLTEPDYQLVWPRFLFVSESAKLLNRREVSDWDELCELLLDQAFITGYEGGPRAEFNEVPAGAHQTGSRLRSGQATPKTVFTRRQLFLKELMRSADLLAENESYRRPYWRERKTPQKAAATLDQEGLVHAFIALVTELDGDGYFEKRFGPDCVDDERSDVAALLFGRELGIDGLWPLQPDRLLANMDVFFDVVELLHDQAARPTSRHYHRFADCGWHHDSFDIGSGRVVYRWRVNQLLERTDLGLRMADEGEDLGRLVTVTDQARAELLQAVVIRDGGPADQIRHALALFRERGADRNQKRSAVAALALVLEERRHGVLASALAKSDRGALFEIANGFHVRHQDAKQKRDYDDFYLDWIFWVYLASIELTDRIIDEQSGLKLAATRRTTGNHSA
jgi:hypothetical protein